jgi:histidyl-tRNA synthetase
VLVNRLALSIFEFYEAVMDEQYLQVLRSIDKYDKIGVDDVVELLQKPIEEFGANLDPISARFFGLFLKTTGETNKETLDNIEKLLKRAPRIRTRIDLIVLLEETLEPNGKTKWERLLEMRRNEDQSWNNGGRPANIAWALDDIVDALITKRQRTDT